MNNIDIITDNKNINEQDQVGNYHKKLLQALPSNVIVGSLITGRLYHGRDPPHVISHIGVYPVLAMPATAISETCNTHHSPPATNVAQ